LGEGGKASLWICPVGGIAQPGTVVNGVVREEIQFCCATNEVVIVRVPVGPSRLDSSEGEGGLCGVVGEGRVFLTHSYGKTFQEMELY
jgi:hypothetical protein